MIKTTFTAIIIINIIVSVSIIIIVMRQHDNCSYHEYHPLHHHHHWLQLRNGQFQFLLLSTNNYIPVDELLPKMKTGKPCHDNLEGKQMRDETVYILHSNKSILL